MLIKKTYNTYFQIDAKDSDLTLKLEVSHEKVIFFLHMINNCYSIYTLHNTVWACVN